MRPALLALVVLAATPGLARAIEGIEDLIVLQNGGRLRGTIVEHEPGGPATIRMPDGSLRVVPADEIAVVRWGDDTTEVEAPADTAHPGAAAPVTESEPADAPAPVRELRTYEEESDLAWESHVATEGHWLPRGPRRVFFVPQLEGGYSTATEGYARVALQVGVRVTPEVHLRVGLLGGVGGLGRVMVATVQMRFAVGWDPIPILALRLGVESGYWIEMTGGLDGGRAVIEGAVRLADGRVELGVQLAAGADALYGLACIECREDRWWRESFEPAFRAGAIVGFVL